MQLRRRAIGNDYCADLLQRLVNIPSVFPREEALVLYLEEELGSLGMPTERLHVEPGRFNLLCRTGRGQPRICLNAHADTVPPNGDATPNARVAGDILYGLGACDDKASVAAMVTATASLHRLGDEIGGSVDLLISIDEEGDAKGVRTALVNGYQCDYAIVGEPTNMDIVCSHAGIVFLSLVTHGVSAHGSTPGNGTNAIALMLQLVDEIGTAVSRFSPHARIGAPSINLGEIRAGDRPNRVPHRCESRIDIRLVPPARVSDVLDAVKDIVEANRWGSFEIEKLGEPLDTPENSPLVSGIQSAAEAIGHRSAVSGWRGWTEAEPFRTVLGVDAVVLGPGDLKHAHSSGECVSLSQTGLAARLYADAVMRIIGQSQYG